MDVEPATRRLTPAIASLAIKTTIVLAVGLIASGGPAP
jgi:hypothetical protein